MGSLRDGHRGRTGWRCRYHHKGRLHIEGNTLALIGEDLLDAIYERAQKTFGPEGDLAYKPFRLYVRNMFLRGNWSGIAVGQTTNLMASLLFPSATVLASVPGTLPGPAVLVPEVDDPSAEPGCNYWTSPDSHRTRLAPNSDFYMLTARLAEYQRQVGPERSTKKRVTGAGSKEHTTYLKALVQYAVGGEDVVMKRLLQRRKAKEGLTMAALDEALVVPNLNMSNTCTPSQATI
ncbi:hypothetical protein RvY_02736-2 [Ramazzottius varieornatus]|uniref:Uncharacterized protein n=1 Tax=Ramazzottius varieornatus TaxID=947166 RepID=A0A1D1ULI6_RAMVA|nr:hypothetical protein RvY_02736-2 [Ramazzottius varieornatus]